MKKIKELTVAEIENNLEENFSVMDLGRCCAKIVLKLPKGIKVSKRKQEDLEYEIDQCLHRIVDILS